MKKGFEVKIRSNEELAHLKQCYTIAKTIAETMTNEERVATLERYEAIDTDWARAMAQGYRESIDMPVMPVSIGYLEADREEPAEVTLCMRRVLKGDKPIYRGKLDNHTFEAFVIGGIEQHPDCLIAATYNMSKTWWGPIEDFSMWAESCVGQDVVFFWD